MVVLHDLEALATLPIQGLNHVSYALKFDLGHVNKSHELTNIRCFDSWATMHLIITTLIKLCILRWTLGTISTDDVTRVVIRVKTLIVNTNSFQITYLSHETFRLSCCPAGRVPAVSLHAMLTLRGV
jgi:hypothetical protein